MRDRRPPAAVGHRAGPHQKRSLSQVTFVGSFPRADFAVTPPRPEIAFIGRSNVGKSSLVNAVLGRKAIARTSKTPGKTRECNVFDVGGVFYLVDLPGYGYAKVSKIERRRLSGLIDHYLRDREPLAGVVWLLDIRRDLSVEDRAVASTLIAYERPVLVALTKADKLSRARQTERTAAVAGQLDLPADQIAVTSALKKVGIEDLRDSVEALLGDV